MQDADKADETAARGVFGGLPSEPAKNGELDLGDENAAMPFARLAPRSAGRPVGATNRRVAQMRDTYLRIGFTHPMLWMGEVLSRPVSQLAEELSCSALEALDVQRKVAGDLLPYLESKMPTQVTAAAGDGVPVLMIGEITAHRASTRGQDGSMAIDDDLAEEIQHFQQVKQDEAKAAADKSHGEASHDTAKPEG